MKQPTTDDRPAEAAPGKPRRSPMRRIARLIQWASHLLMIVLILLIFTPVGSWYGRDLIVIDELAPADYLVVIGGASERAVEAARLYRDGWAKKVVVTGIAEGAANLARVARDYGVPEEALLIDDRARRTASHPETMRRLAGVNPQRDRFLLVTSLYQSRRVKACFEHAGYKHIIVRVPSWYLENGRTIPRQGYKGRSRFLMRKTYEYAAWAYYKLRGWL